MEAYKYISNFSPIHNNFSGFCHTCFTCLPLFFFYFFLKHLKTNLRYCFISTYRLQYVSLKPMNIFLHNQSIVITHNKILAHFFVLSNTRPIIKLSFFFFSFTGGWFKLGSSSGPPLRASCESEPV